MKNTHASERFALIRLASRLPPGSPERKTILAGLKEGPGRFRYLERMEERSRYLRGEARSRYLRGEAKKARFTFRTQALEDLWNEELTGQISDGMWENTSNSGWEFWVSIPTSVGGKTQLTGAVPGGIKQGFGFEKLVPIVGDDMLETIQKSEPDATMGTVVMYIKEIRKALIAARKGEDIPDPPATTGPTVGAPSDLEQTRIRANSMMAILDAAGLLKIGPKATLGEAFLYASSGRRAGQYHYFALIEDPKRGYQAATAYGKVGRAPRAVLIGPPTWDRSKALKALGSKARAKLRSGYMETPLLGVKKPLRLF